MNAGVKKANSQKYREFAGAYNIVSSPEPKAHKVSL